MKIWCISDTHCKHRQLKVPEVDMIIHAGDAANNQNFSFNEAEVRDFLLWYNKLPAKYKIFIPGNHETSVEKGMHNFNNYENVTVLINNSITIEDIKIYGSPITPSFGTGWAYNCARHKINNHWNNIPDDTNILVTHGPPKGILDLTAHNGLEQTGCKSLLNRVSTVKPKYHIFGHIHDEPLCYNAGVLKHNDIDTNFVNASVNNLKYNVVNNGVIINYG